VDIPLLADAFLKESAVENGKPVRELTPEAMAAVLDYDWPGNVRELRTAIEHGVVMSSAPKIALRDLPASVRNGKASLLPSAPGGLNLQETETALIVRALEDCRGNRTEAAQMLGISRRTLHRRLKDLNISKRNTLS
jgi:DNA-binding NtrC family response regulator